MAKRLICLILVVAFAVISSPSAWAQGQSYQPQGPKRQLATIIFAGLGGAVLGLSTLSFYGRPQDKLNNIAIGFAVGVISGTVYTTYKTATQPRSFYSSLESEAFMQFEASNDRFAALAAGDVPLMPLQFEYSF